MYFPKTNTCVLVLFDKIHHKFFVPLLTLFYDREIKNYLEKLIVAYIVLGNLNLRLNR